jgi:DNA-binding response OmpR family regulator
MAKIVVAEDDQLISSTLCDALKAAGHEAMPALDGEAAVALIKQEKPQLALLDIMMPKLDGVGVVWELKQDPETSGIPVIVLTNMSDADTISKIIAAGATDYLLKSDQSMDAVVKKVNEVLNRQIKL